MASRHATRAGELAKIGLISVALLGVGELALRGWRLAAGGPTTTAVERLFAEVDVALGLYRRHPFLNTAPRAGVSVEAFGKRATLNSRGYRSPERPLERPAGTLRVLCSGGSTTFDILASEDADTWPWRLESLLADAGAGHGPERVEVWNAGFPGWTSTENLISLLIRDVDLAPDFAVLFQGINDLQPATHRPFDPQYASGHAELARRAAGFDREPLGLFDRSLLVESARGALGLAEDPWLRLRAAPEDAARIDRLPDRAALTFERNVLSFVALARRAGAEPVLVTQTVRLRGATLEADSDYLAGWLPGLAPASAPAALERLNDVLRDVSRAQGARLLDAAAEVPWSDEDFADPMHFSPSGSRRFAERLAAFLVAQR